MTGKDAEQVALSGHFKKMQDFIELRYEGIIGRDPKHGTEEQCEKIWREKKIGQQSGKEDERGLTLL